MTKERVMDILARYVDNDLCSADPDYVREVLLSICTMEEIKELGLDYLWDDLNQEVYLYEGISVQCKKRCICN